MTDAAAADPDHGILVVRGSRAARLQLRAAPHARASGSATTRSLPSVDDAGAADPHRGEPRDRARARPTSPALTGLGVAFVYAPRPADIAPGRQPGQRQRAVDRAAPPARRPGLAGGGTPDRRRPAARPGPAAALAARSPGPRDPRRRWCSPPRPGRPADERRQTGARRRAAPAQVRRPRRRRRRRGARARARGRAADRPPGAPATDRRRPAAGGLVVAHDVRLPGPPPPRRPAATAVGLGLAPAPAGAARRRRRPAVTRAGRPRPGARSTRAPRTVADVPATGGPAVRRRPGARRRAVRVPHRHAGRPHPRGVDAAPRPGREWWFTGAGAGLDHPPRWCSPTSTPVRRSSTSPCSVPTARSTRSATEGITRAAPARCKRHRPRRHRPADRRPRRRRARRPAAGWSPRSTTPTRRRPPRTPGQEWLAGDRPAEPDAPARRAARERRRRARCWSPTPPTSRRSSTCSVAGRVRDLRPDRPRHRSRSRPARSSRST